MKRIEWGPVVVAVLGGVAFRALVISCVAYRTDSGDASGYIAIAENIASHGVFATEPGSPPTPTMVRAPLYPLLLAAKTALFGSGALATQVIQVLLGTVSPLALYLLANERWPKRARAILWVGMLCPSDAIYTGAHLTETLCTALLTVAVCLPALRPHDLRAWLAGGVSFGLCILTRDVYLPFPLAIGALCFTFSACRFGAQRALPAAFVLAALLTVAPWTIRNFVVFERVVPVSKGLLGMNLWFGTWERDGEWVSLRGPDLRVYPPEAYRHQEDRDRVSAILDLPIEVQDRAFLALATDRIRNMPLQTFATYLARAPNMWLGTRTELFSFRPLALTPGRPLWYAMKLSLYAFNLGVLLCAVVGIAILLRRERSEIWFVMPVLLTVCVYFPVHNSETRYTQPVYPLLLLFAVHGCEAIRKRFRSIDGARSQTRVFDVAAPGAPGA